MQANKTNTLLFCLFLLCNKGPRIFIVNIAKTSSRENVNFDQLITSYVLTLLELIT